MNRAALIEIVSCTTLLMTTSGLAGGKGKRSSQPVQGSVAGVNLPELHTTRISSGLSLPLYVTAPPGDFNRIFVVEQRGSGGVPTRGDIRVVNLTTNPPTTLAQPFLSVTVSNVNNEQGLLGLAFDPKYLSNGIFYINYTAAAGVQPGGVTRVEQFVDTNPLDNVHTGLPPTLILEFDQPEGNHNGGWIAFGPDGYLYISTGDGGGANDSGPLHDPNTGNGQSLNTVLGKMLRIDPTGPDAFPVDPRKNFAIPPDNPFVGGGGLDEIWAYGLRNPWRSAFDRETGDLYIADVGQNIWEEVDFQPAASTGGENYGWRCYEGNAAFNLTNCQPANTMVFPIHAYSHGGNPFRCSITGGYVYRGSEIPSLRGTYFFADFCSAQIWTFRYTGVVNPPVTDRTGELAPGGGLNIIDITSFGEDAAAELYICDRNGEVFKVVRQFPCPADVGPNGGDDQVNVTDLLAVIAGWGSCPKPCPPFCAADVNEDCAVNVTDLLEVIGAWGACQ